MMSSTRAETQEACGAEQASFLAHSPHIARRFEGSKCRENLDSEICEGLRQQVGERSTGQPRRLDSPNAEKAQSAE